MKILYILVAGVFALAACDKPPVSVPTPIPVVAAPVADIPAPAPTVPVASGPQVMRKCIKVFDSTRGEDVEKCRDITIHNKRDATVIPKQ